MACLGCFMVALILSPTPNPSSSTPNIQTHHSRASGICTSWSRCTNFLLSLPFLLTSSTSSKDWTGLLLWFGGGFFQFLLTSTQALAIALWSSLWVDGSVLSLIKPVCKCHLESYSLRKPPVYCFLVPGFLRPLDLEKREQVCMLNEVC